MRGKEFAALSADLTRLATPDLAVLRGPVPSGLDVLREPTVSPVLAWIGVVLTICALSAIGSGFAAIAVRSRAGHALDAAALAPAFGAVAVTLVGVSVALAGGDPTGPVGWALAGAVGAGGILTALVGRTHGVGSRVTQMLSVHGKREGCRPR